MSTLNLPDPDRGILARRNDIVKQLKRLVPDAVLIADEEGCRTFESDALTAYRCLPLAVVLPGTTEEVAAILRFCQDNHIKVVPRGAGTSLTGSALPLEDAIVLCLSRMNKVLEIDPKNRAARVEAGITNIAITEAASKYGYFYAPDPSSQIACTVGGNIATNSGGAHCLKYGVTTNNLLGVTMVLMDGQVIEIGGPALDAPGYDLLGIICGSEGQLGVVTEATLRILKKPEGARPVLIGFESSVAAGACVADIIRAGVLPVAIEFMDRPCIRACENFAHAGYPDVEALLIIEVEGSKSEIDHQMALIREIALKHDPAEIRESASEAESALIWKGRKAAFGAMGQIADYICLDGTIPVSELPLVLRRIGEMTESYGLAVANVFHAGDGNMHPLILYDANKPGDLDKAEDLGADILKLCVEVGGCLTGEHGVGVEKRDLMLIQYSEIDLEAQMRVKDVFDPNWLLNPAKVFPLASTGSRRAA